MLNVSLLHSEDCDRCAGVLTTLETLRKEYPKLKVEEIEAMSDEGQSLILRHGIIQSPGILVNGSFFAMGEPSIDSFRNKFNELMEK